MAESNSARFSSRAIQTIAEDKLRAAYEQGEFDNLPGLGQPSPMIDQPYHPLWWIARKLQREQLLPKPKHQRTGHFNDQ